VLSQTVTDSDLSFSIPVNIFKFVLTFNGARELFQALRYKAKGRGFDIRWGHGDYGFGVEAPSNRNEY